MWSCASALGGLVVNGHDIYTSFWVFFVKGINAARIFLAWKYLLYMWNKVIVGKFKHVLQPPGGTLLWDLNRTCGYGFQGVLSWTGYLFHQFLSKQGIVTWANGLNRINLDVCLLGFRRTKHIKMKQKKSENPRSANGRYWFWVKCLR